MRAISGAVSINPGAYEYLQGPCRKIYFGPDYREGIAVFREKRPAKF